MYIASLGVNGVYIASLVGMRHILASLVGMWHILASLGVYQQWYIRLPATLRVYQRRYPASLLP